MKIYKSLLVIISLLCSAQTLAGSRVTTWPEKTVLDGSEVLALDDGANKKVTVSNLRDVVKDLTPQLGADLDVNAKGIVSVSNGNIELSPHGTGETVIDSTLVVTPVPDAAGGDHILLGTATSLGAFSQSNTVEVYSSDDESWLVAGTGDTDGDDVNLGGMAVTWDTQTNHKMGKIWLQSYGSTATKRGSMWTFTARADGDETAEADIQMVLRGPNLGLGTEDPQRVFDVVRPGGVDTVIGIRVDDTTAAAGIDFGDSAASDAGRILYSNNGHRFQFVAEGSTLLRLDADGNGVAEFDADFEIGAFAAPTFTIDKLTGDAYIGGAVTRKELSADPADPAEGMHVVWQSDGTGSGDDGDIMMKITINGTTKTVTIDDSSTAGN